jgi:hypothetical protein
MGESERLIRDLDESHASMKAALVDISLHMEIYPGWTIKEVLAHLAGWDEAVTAALRAHAGGDEPGTPAVRGIDFYNAESVATRQALSYDQVVREWDLARAELKTILAAMPAQKFKERMLYPWGGTGNISQLVAIFVDHEREHAAEITEIEARTDQART